MSKQDLKEFYMVALGPNGDLVGPEPTTINKAETNGTKLVEPSNGTSSAIFNLVKKNKIIGKLFSTKDKAVKFLKNITKLKKNNKSFSELIESYDENNKMSLLKVNLEDLLTAKTNDARAIAKSTTAHDQDDLVGDKDREKDDGGASDAIDTALKTGKVHQESILNIEDELSEFLERKFISLSKDDPRHFQDLHSRIVKQSSKKKEPKKAKKESFIEAKELNDKVFLNKSEQMAFAHYVARKEMRHPMSGAPMMDDIEMMSIVNQVEDFKHLADMMAETSVHMGLNSDDNYIKMLSKAMEKAMSLDPKSSEILMWRTVTSKLQPLV